MKKIDYIFLIIIIFAALVTRLYKIDAPLSDYHSWRQVDTAAVSRNFMRDGINLLSPRYDDLSSLQTGMENPEGLRMVEFPIYNALTAILPTLNPNLPIEISGRIISIFFSIITLYVIYYLVRNEVSITAAIFSSLAYALSPFMVFFSRVVLPETTAVGFTMLSILSLYISLKKPEKIKIIPFILSVVFLGLGILIKPTVIFYLITAFVFIVYKYRHEVVKVPYLYLYTILSLLPFLIWRIYISNFPEGIPASNWLFTMVNTFEGPKDIFFRPAFFRWIFMERIGTYILGIYGVLFLGLGLIAKYRSILIPSLTVSALTYLFVFQGGNVQHEYYQTVIFPVLAILIGSGASLLFDLSTNKFNRFLSYPLVVVFFIFMIVFSYYKVKDYYTYPQDLNQISELIKLLTDKNDKIVTDRLGDTTLLYLSDRKGAPAIYKDPEELKNLGYSHIVTANKETATTLKSRGFKVLAENDLCTIVSLN